MSAAENVFDKGWQYLKDEVLGASALFFDSPKGKTVYAHGASDVLIWLRDHPKDWQRLYDDLHAFCEEYMQP